MVPRDVPPQL
jgi:hypothetical protein